MAYRAPLQEITRQHSRFGSSFNHNNNNNNNINNRYQSNYKNMNNNHNNNNNMNMNGFIKPKCNQNINNMVGDNNNNNNNNNNNKDKNVRFVFCSNVALGSGAYGTVYPAFDRYLNKNVAIKVIKPQSENALLCPTTIREVGLLKSIKHKNIIQLLDMNQEAKTSIIYLVFERADYDLKKFWTRFYRKNNFLDKNNIISIELIKNIMIQIICAISFLHSIKIIHRDIKPQNILLFIDENNKNYKIKIADFGLARGNNQPNLSLTTEVVTLWYRPIELLLGCKTYDKSVDIWAIGCVLYELITNQPLFPAMTQIETIFKIFQFCNIYNFYFLFMYKN